MKVTLRKANVIQASINEALKGLEFSDTVSINEFQNAQDVLTTANARFIENVLRRQLLLDALYDIRTQVGEANHKANIDGRLAEVARLEKDIQFFAKFAASRVHEDPQVIAGKLSKIRNRKDESYYGRDEFVITAILAVDQVEKFKATVADLKKRKQKLQDELLEANVRTEIELSATTVSTLTKENIL